ncbi:hypothetical protein [Halomonas binhaiensis]|uniref:Uncharacterized protein n=1 Tax=Halomonas binhaiensis TaxID=2562282 RepID=A0A7U3HWP4_9GAMM|nr:hypothetical protein [Halomonas binhaiensis]QRG26810.1 hypothetical protein E4T21_21505 [Halomonas binhaiensis]
MTVYIVLATLSIITIGLGVAAVCLTRGYERDVQELVKYAKEKGLVQDS